MDEVLKWIILQPLAVVQRHPQNPSVWGLKNLSPVKWVITAPDGAIRDVEPGRSVTLALEADGPAMQMTLKPMAVHDAGVGMATWVLATIERVVLTRADHERELVGHRYGHFAEQRDAGSPVLR